MILPRSRCPTQLCGAGPPGHAVRGQGDGSPQKHTTLVRLVHAANDGLVLDPMTLDFAALRLAKPPITNGRLLGLRPGRLLAQSEIY